MRMTNFLFMWATVLVAFGVVVSAILGFMLLCDTHPNVAMAVGVFVISGVVALIVTNES